MRQRMRGEQYRTSKQVVRTVRWLRNVGKCSSGCEANSTGQANKWFVLFGSCGMQEKCGNVCEANSTGQANLRFVLFGSHEMQEKCGNVCEANSTGQANLRFVLFGSHEM